MIVYFMYSSQQVSVRTEADARVGKTYTPGMVLVNGRMKQYTEMVSDPTKATYSDAVLVAFGEKNKMKYRS